MQDKLLVALIISIIYVIFKFIDMRFVQKDNKTPPKNLMKDSIYSFVSCLSGLYLVEYFGLFSDSMPKNQTGAFLDEPNF
tara:strand:+ start:250 stop:489 length:240 start_codon:yes stop_codon:yes gene_type:complete